jgi:NADH dehydrogenase (ubiquinone) 1 beta subcomplex subunit 8
MWGPDIPPAGLTPESALRQLLGALAGFAALGLFIKYYGIPERPAVPREFPYDGLVKELGGVEEIKVGAIEAWRCCRWTDHICRRMRSDRGASSR